MTPLRFFLAVAFVAAGAVAPAQQPQPAQQLDAASFVRSLYHRYTGVDPDRATVDVWVRELSKGVSPTEVHAQILGSNQTFENARKNADTWVRMMYAELLGREPDAAGQRHWIERLAQLKNDRVKIAREFLISAGAEIAAGGGNRPGVIPPADLPAQLKATSEALAQAVLTEFPGRDHFMLRSQVGSFTKSVAEYQPILKEPKRYSKEYPDGLLALTATLDALDRGVAQSRLPAPNTRLHAEQCRQLLAALGQAGGVVVPPPVAPPHGGRGWLTQAEAREYRKLLEAVSKELTAAEATLRVVIPSGWTTTRLLNQVDAIAAEVDSLRTDLRSGLKREELGTRVQGIHSSAGAVGEALSTGRTDLRAVQAWFSVSRSLESVSGALALGGPDRPGGGRVSADVFKAIDQAVAECDALLVAFSPYATYNRSVARFTADLTELKNRYSALRRAVGQLTVSRRDLDAHLESIDQRMTTVGTNWREATRDRRLSDAPDLIDLQSADRDLTKLIATIK